MKVYRHPWLRHLRLGFNLLLSPLFTWGLLLAGGELTEPQVWAAYLALHIFLYGGTTAFNSYYDRDEGPVGGMLSPPGVSRGLLAFSLAVQLLGLGLALLVNRSFVLVYVLLFLVATAYSHPAVRLKSGLLSSLLAVALGQGGLGFSAGWVVASPRLASLLTPHALWGALSSALLVSGLYLVTQSFQRREDEARGDLTLSVVMGERRALAFALLLLGLGGSTLIAQTVVLFGWAWALTLVAFFTALAWRLLAWIKDFDPDAVVYNFRMAMRLTALSAIVLVAFIVYHLLRFEA